MGGIIESVAGSCPPEDVEADGASTAGAGSCVGARQLADQAVIACLEQATCAPEQVGMLINAGVYREANLGEPALAAMIQEDIHMNAGEPEAGTHQGTFSFDLANGGAGVVTALYLLDGFLCSGAIARGLVVASDVDPDPAGSPGVTFPSAGAAMLVSGGPQDAGFVDFLHATAPEPDQDVRVRLQWRADASPPEGASPYARGGHVIDWEQGPAYRDRAVSQCVRQVDTLLARNGLGRQDLALVLPSQQPLGFPAALRRALELPNERVVDLPGAQRGTHTAGPLLAAQSARYRGAWPDDGHILFATVGAGLTVALALYRQAPAE